MGLRRRNRSVPLTRRCIVTLSGGSSGSWPSRRHAATPWRHSTRNSFWRCGRPTTAARLRGRRRHVAREWTDATPLSDRCRRSLLRDALRSSAAPPPRRWPTGAAGYPSPFGRAPAAARRRQGASRSSAARRLPHWRNADAARRRRSCGPTFGSWRGAGVTARRGAAVGQHQRFSLVNRRSSLVRASSISSIDWRWRGVSLRSALIASTDACRLRCPLLVARGESSPSDPSH